MSSEINNSAIILKTGKVSFRPKRKRAKKGDEYKSENVPKLWLKGKACLFSTNDVMYLSLEEMVEVPHDTKIIDDPYDLPEHLYAHFPASTNPQPPVSLLKPLLAFRTCTIKEMHIDKELVLHVVTLSDRSLFTPYKIRIGLSDPTEAAAWHSSLQPHIKNRRLSRPRRPSEPSVPHSRVMEDTIIPPAQPPTDRSHSTSDAHPQVALIENDIYESTTPMECFNCTVIDTRKSLELGFYGDYLLRANTDCLELLNFDHNVVHRWQLKSIRKFGVTNNVLCLEAGSKCDGGEGQLHFTVERGSDLLQNILLAKDNLQRQPRPKEPESPMNGKPLDLLEDEYSTIDMHKKKAARQHNGGDSDGSASPVPPPLPTNDMTDSTLEQEGIYELDEGEYDDIVGARPHAQTFTQPEVPPLTPARPNFIKPEGEASSSVKTTVDSSVPASSSLPRSGSPKKPPIAKKPSFDGEIGLKDMAEMNKMLKTLDISL